LTVLFIAVSADFMLIVHTEETIRADWTLISLA
jgi:hypothetical protein